MCVSDKGADLFTVVKLKWEESIGHLFMYILSISSIIHQLVICFLILVFDPVSYKQNNSVCSNILIFTTMQKRDHCNPKKWWASVEKKDDWKSQSNGRTLESPENFISKSSGQPFTEGRGCSTEEKFIYTSERINDVCPVYVEKGNLN